MKQRAYLVFVLLMLAVSTKGAAQQILNGFYASDTYRLLVSDDSAFSFYKTDDANAEYINGKWIYRKDTLICYQPDFLRRIIFQMKVSDSFNLRMLYADASVTNRFSQAIISFHFTNDFSQKRTVYHELNTLMAVFDGSFKLQRFRLMYFDKNKLSLGYCDYADGLKHGNELRCNETKGTGGQCTPTMLRTYKKGLLHGFSVLFENGLPQVKYYYRQGQLKRTKELNR